MTVPELLQRPDSDAMRARPCKADPLAWGSTAEGATCLPQNLEVSQQIICDQRMFTCLQYRYIRVLDSRLQFPRTLTAPVSHILICSSATESWQSSATTSI